MSTFTYDVSTNVGKVRLNIADIDLRTITGTRPDWTVLFTDEEIEVFITRAESNINLASAYALYAIASSRVLLAKKKQLGDYMEDLTAIGKEVRAQAKAFVDISEDAPAGAYAEQGVTDFAARDIIWNNELRS